MPRAALGFSIIIFSVSHRPFKRNIESGSVLSSVHQCVIVETDLQRRGLVCARWV